MQNIKTHKAKETSTKRLFCFSQDFLGGGLYIGEIHSPGMKKVCWGSENFILIIYIGDE